MMILGIVIHLLAVDAVECGYLYWSIKCYKVLRVCQLLVRLGFVSIFPSISSQSSHHINGVDQRTDDWGDHRLITNTTGLNSLGASNTYSGVGGTPSRRICAWTLKINTVVNGTNTRI